MFINKDDFIKHPFQNSLVKRLSPSGLVLLEGQQWKKHRRLISKGFDYTLIDELLTIVKIASSKRTEQLTDGQVIGNAFNFFKETAGNIISLVYFQEDILSTSM
jgi:cytochrome P450